MLIRVWYAVVWSLLLVATIPAMGLLILSALTGYEWQGGVDVYVEVVIARAYYGGLAWPDPED